MAAQPESGLSVLWDAPLVRKLNSAIHLKHHSPGDKCEGTQMRYPLDRELSGG